MSQKTFQLSHKLRHRSRDRKKVIKGSEAINFATPERKEKEGDNDQDQF